jgi:predicted peptidase
MYIQIPLFTLILIGLTLTLKSQDHHQIIKENFIRKIYTDSVSQYSIEYRLFDPSMLQDKMESDEKIPIILFLHGAGERGNDNAKQLTWGIDEVLNYMKLTDKKALIIIPQCPLDQKWVNTDWSENKHQMPIEMSKPLSNAWHITLEHAAKPYIDENRIIVIGLSMGGYGTWDLLQRFAPKIYAAVPICGGGDPSYSHLMVNNKIWVFHGEQDTVVPYSRSKEMVQSLTAMNAPNIRFTSLPYVGHNSWSPAFAMNELWEWIFN